MQYPLEVFYQSSKTFHSLLQNNMIDAVATPPLIYTPYTTLVHPHKVSHRCHHHHSHYHNQCGVVILYSRNINQKHMTVLYRIIYATLIGIYSCLALSSIDPRRQITGVTLKIAFDSSGSQDLGEYGGVADASAIKSERFTSPESLDMVHRLRRDCGCVLVGRSTVEIDDCTLTVRRVPLRDGGIQPVRVVLDPSLSLLKQGSDKFTMFNDENEVIIYHCCEDEVKSPNEHVHLVSATSDEGDDVNNQSKIKARFIVNNLNDQFGIDHIMVEGGPVTAKTFLEEGLVDRAIVVKAPVFFNEPIPSNLKKQSMTDAGLMQLGSYKNSGGDEIECWARDGTIWPGDSDYTSWP